MKISLVSLYNHSATGIRTLYPIIKKNGFQPEIILFKSWVNNSFKKPSDREIKLLMDWTKDSKVVGLSFFSPYLELAKYLSHIFKKKGKIVLWGGIHASACPEDGNNYAHAVISGEGEGAIIDALNQIKKDKGLEKIQNITTFCDGQSVSWALRPLVELDSVPIRHHGKGVIFIDNNQLYNGDPILKHVEYDIICSRGCPFSCSYCHNSLYRNLYESYGQRLRPVASIIEELLLMKSTFSRVAKVKFDDDCFPGDINWLKKWAEEYKKNINLPGEVLVNPNILSEEMAYYLSKAGIRRVQLGIESGSSEKRAQIFNRNVENLSIVKAAKYCKKHGLEVIYDIIVDDPKGDWQSKKDLFRLLNKLPSPFTVYLYSLTHYPGTELTKKLLKQGLLSPDMVEGKNKKSFEQFRVTLDYKKRSDLDKWTVMMVVLFTKPFIPRRLMWLILRKWPKNRINSLALLAKTANLLYMIYYGIRMFFRGELNFQKIEEYASFSRMITQ